VTSTDDETTQPPKEDASPETSKVVDGNSEVSKVPEKGDSEPRPPSDNKGSKVDTDAVKSSAGVIAFLVFFFGILIYASIQSILPSSDTLDVFTTAKFEGDHYNVSGVVTQHDGTPVPARVWAVASDDQGNRNVVFPPTGKAQANGVFQLPTISQKLDGNTKLATISVLASYLPDGSDKEAKPQTGRDLHTVNREDQNRIVQLPPRILWFITAVFFLSVAIGVANLDRSRVIGRALRYYALMALAFMLMLTMVGYVAVGYTQVNALGKGGDILSLGFATIYKGTYVKSVPDEWLLSMTSPVTVHPEIRDVAAVGVPPKPLTTAGSLQNENDQVARGFGAPLWVIFMSVLGSCLFTISLLVKQVNDPVNFQDDTIYPNRLEEILRHQFYVIFSPLGAIIVYQIMIAAEMATHPVTVALAAIAAGIAVNAILDKSLKVVTDLISSDGTGGKAKAGAQPQPTGTS